MAIQRQATEPLEGTTTSQGATNRTHMGQGDQMEGRFGCFMSEMFPACLSESVMWQVCVAVACCLFRHAAWQASLFPASPPACPAGGQVGINYPSTGMPKFFLLRCARGLIRMGGEWSHARDACHCLSQEG